jgi:membrane associated rhomboid family serine protease/Zn-finger nucleic acid-binding protein
MLKCPTCRNRLLRVKGAAVFSYVCPRCRGRAVSLSVVGRAAGQACVRQLWVQKDRAAVVSGKKCPVCDHWMREVPVTIAKKELRLDVCRPCRFVWFDPREFEALPAAPPKPAEPELPLEAREKVAVAQIRFLEERAKGAEIAEEFGEEAPEEPWKWIPAMFGLPVEEETSPLRSWPWVTWGLAALLVLVYAVTAHNLDQAVRQFGLIPRQTFRGGEYTLFTNFFIHGGLWHLVANVYFLVVFGDHVEDFLGRWRYVALLVAACLTGDLLHILAEPRGDIPAVGASGGISGVIVFYGLQFPHARLGILIRYWYVLRWLYLPAWAALIAWFAIQLLGAWLQVAGASAVSALAHLGGAATGLVVWIVWRNRV